MPVVIPVLTKLGIIDNVQQQAYLNRDGIFWRTLEGTELAHLPLSSSNSDGFGGVLLFGQYRMTVLLLEQLRRHPTVEVRFGLRYGGVEDLPEADHVKVLVHSKQLNVPDHVLFAKYVVAADGANSTVRRSLCITFDGFTYSGWKMIGTDIVYDFIGQENYSYLNFIVHPAHFAVIAYTGQDAFDLPRDSGKPLWRVAYIEPPDLPSTPQDYLERARQRLPLWMRGDKNFEILRAEPYINSQRCASQARKGRVLLAGDALHVSLVFEWRPLPMLIGRQSNNPIGGLGLTGGILDAFCYGNALVRVIQRGESDDLLTECANARREAWLNVTNELSQANIGRLFGDDEDSIALREAFFDKLRNDAGFPGMIRAGFDKMMPNSFE
jgi:2-polyprenyl-6-methoxyphenol hydroxylase-like FAD-dependent oxidoreductase